MEHIKNERHVVLSRDTYDQVIHELCRSLPPPVSDRPEDLVSRDNAAMEEVASLRPADPAEAVQACKFVAACAYAMDCLRLANEHRADLAVSMKCMAQAARMMRQSCCARSLLLRIQEARRKREALGIASDEPAWSDHGILDRMTEALRRAQADAPKAGPAGATVAGTTERPVNMRDAHPAVASSRTDPPAGGVPPVQTVSQYETNSQNHANETSVRLGSPAAALGDAHAAPRPRHHPNERPEAPLAPGSAIFFPAKPPLPAADFVTNVVNRVLHIGETTKRARAA